MSIKRSFRCPNANRSAFGFMELFRLFTFQLLEGTNEHFSLDHHVIVVIYLAEVIMVVITQVIMLLVLVTLLT